MLFFQKKALLVEKELSYGVDPMSASPNDGAQAVLARNLTITPLNAELHKREVVLPAFGDLGAIPGGAHVSLEFEVEVAGAGGVGTVPQYSPLLTACAWQEASDSPSEGVNYAPVSLNADFGSCTFYFYLDGIRHIVTGARGKLAWAFSHDQFPVMKFSMLGIYNAPTDVSIPALDFDGWQTPLPMNKTNTTFSIHGYSAVLQSLEIDDSTVVEFKDYVNASQEVRITGRPGVTGTAKIEAKSLATKDWFAIARAGTLGVLDIVHGTTAGNRVQLTAPRVQIGNPNYEDDNGLTLLSLPLMFNISGDGNNEYTIRVR